MVNLLVRSLHPSTNFVKNHRSYLLKQGQCFQIEFKWSRRSELNRRPTDYESVALPLSYAGRLAIFAPQPLGKQCTVLQKENALSVFQL
jgi:hypothetical protein